jgi:hypothetical protein
MGHNWCPVQVLDVCPRARLVLPSAYLFWDLVAQSSLCGESLGLHRELSGDLIEVDRDRDESSLTTTNHRQRQNSYSPETGQQSPTEQLQPRDRPQSPTEQLQPRDRPQSPTEQLQPRDRPTIPDRGGCLWHLVPILPKMLVAFLQIPASSPIHAVGAICGIRCQFCRKFCQFGANFLN